AAYAARANIKCVVILPAGGIAKGKLAQAMMYGATVIAVTGNFDDALRIVREIGEKTGIQIVNSINPDRIEGQKTAAFEVCDALGRAPDYHLLPVGNAGNITAYWKGYREYRDAKLIQFAPKMVGFQAEVTARDDSGGLIDMVSDTEITESYKLVAAREGVYVEPASGASVAGLIKYAKNNYFAKGATIVLTLTGHGLKDPDTAIASAST